MAMRIAVAFLLLATAGPMYPSAPRDASVVELHGQRIPDPYRPLEDLRAAATRDWVHSQERLLEGVLASVPLRSALRQRLRELAPRGVDTVPIPESGRYWFTRRAADETARLFVRDSTKGAPRLVFDPSTADARYTIAGFAPQPGGSMVLVGLTLDRSRWIGVHVLDTATGQLSAVLGRTHSVAGFPVWRRDGSGFYFVAFAVPPAGAEATAAVRSAHLVFRTLAGHEETVYTPRDDSATIAPAVSTDGRWLVVSEVAGGTGAGRLLVWDLKRRATAANIIRAAENGSLTWLGSRGSSGFLLTNSGAPRGRIVRVDLTAPGVGPWNDIIPEAKDAIAGNSAVGGNAVGYVGDRFVVAYLRDGQQVIKLFGPNGTFDREVALPVGGAIWGGFSGESTRTEAFFQYLGLADPNTLYRLNTATGTLETLSRAETPFDARDIQVRQVFYKGADGARIPMFIAHRRDLPLDGKRPTYMYGYGAFGWVSFVWYQPKVIAWLELGGVYAQPSIRGGGEYGEEWHRAGSGANKGVATSDYEAALDWLVREKITTLDRFVVNGGSASGPLAANVLLHRRDSIGAVVIDRPILDLLRFDQFTQGAYWASEFGSPKAARDFDFLKSYSPLHNLRADSCYAPTLIVSGDHDQTAVPGHAYKFTAALQAAQSCPNTVALKVVRGADHNYGTLPSELVDAFGDELAFLASILKLQPSDFKPLTPGRSPESLPD